MTVIRVSHHVRRFIFSATSSGVTGPHVLTSYAKKTASL
jgi:hypothetical protein